MHNLTYHLTTPGPRPPRPANALPPGGSSYSFAEDNDQVLYFYCAPPGPPDEFRQSPCSSAALQLCSSAALLNASLLAYVSQRPLCVRARMSGEHAVCHRLSSIIFGPALTQHAKTCRVATPFSPPFSRPLFSPLVPPSLVAPPLLPPSPPRPHVYSSRTGRWGLGTSALTLWVEGATGPCARRATLGNKGRRCEAKRRTRDELPLSPTRSWWSWWSCCWWCGVWRSCEQKCFE